MGLNILWSTTFLFKFLEDWLFECSDDILKRLNFTLHHLLFRNLMVCANNRFYVVSLLFWSFKIQRWLCNRFRSYRREWEIFHLCLTSLSTRWWSTHVILKSLQTTCDRRWIIYLPWNLVWILYSWITSVISMYSRVLLILDYYHCILLTSSCIGLSKNCRFSLSSNFFYNRLIHILLIQFGNKWQHLLYDYF